MARTPKTTPSKYNELKTKLDAHQAITAKICSSGPKQAVAKTGGKPSRDRVPG